MFNFAMKIEELFQLYNIMMQNSAILHDDANKIMADMKPILEQLLPLVTQMKDIKGKLDA